MKKMEKGIITVMPETENDGVRECSEEPYDSTDNDCPEEPGSSSRPGM